MPTYLEDGGRRLNNSLYSFQSLLGEIDHPEQLCNLFHGVNPLIVVPKSLEDTTTALGLL